MKYAIGVGCLSAALVACGGVEELAPLTTSSTTTTTTTMGPVDAGPDAAETPPDAGLVKRTVMTRNPYGTRAGNHLIDGDFEMSTVPGPGGQLPWRAFATNGTTEVLLATETGGLCRSGLRCAVLEPDTVLLIRGSAAKDKGSIASAWAKPTAPATCNKVRPMLIECDTFTVRKTISLTETVDGWCHFTAKLTEQDAGTCVYVENTLPDGTTALLDSFTLGPDDGTVQPLSSEFWVPEEATVMRLSAMRGHILATTRFGKAPERPLPTP